MIGVTFIAGSNKGAEAVAADEEGSEGIPEDRVLYFEVPAAEYSFFGRWYASSSSLSFLAEPYSSSSLSSFLPRFPVLLDRFLFVVVVVVVAADAKDCIGIGADAGVIGVAAATGADLEW